MAEGQQAWKQACTERWDAFLVDKDMSPLPDTPSVWLSAFRWVKLPWGPEPLLQQHPIYRLTRLIFRNMFLLNHASQQHMPCSDHMGLCLCSNQGSGLFLPMYASSKLALNDYCRTRIGLPTCMARACDSARRAQQCARSDNPKASHACPAGKPIDLRKAFELTMRVRCQHTAGLATHWKLYPCSVLCRLHA